MNSGCRAHRTSDAGQTSRMTPVPSTDASAFLALPPGSPAGPAWLHLLVMAFAIAVLVRSLGRNR